MKVILSNLCFSLSGSLGRGYGYHFEQRPNGCIVKRNSKGFVPPDGHWRFIVLCAELAVGGFPIADIRVSREEVKQALYEAHIFIAMQNLRLDNYNARDIINLKTTFGL